jgi:hypothetical protein
MDSLPSLANIYQLIGFIVVAGLQIYTRVMVGRLAKNQEVLIARHDASRAEVLRLSEHAYDLMAHQEHIRIEDAKATIIAALRVAYFQGQADAGTDHVFPEERAKNAAETLVNIAAQAVRNGHGKAKVNPPDEGSSPTIRSTPQ